jgi:putative membrane protein
MDRRSVILAAAATAVAAPIFAQTKDSPPSTGTNPPPAPQPNSAPAPALSQAAKTHVEKTAQIGHASLEMANLALEKARGAKVKEFAKFEHDEQTTMAEVLKSMDPSLTPPSPPAEVAQAIDKLKQLKSGETFDREFVSAQIKGHQMLRRIQEDYLKAGENSEGINTTKLALGMINEHLMLLDDLQKTHLARL